MDNVLGIESRSITHSRLAWADLTGLIASIGCAVHCAAMPILIGYLPSLGLSWLATQGFHQGMAVLCSLIAIAAFLPGWRKHNQLFPAALGLLGIAFLTSHAFGSHDCCTKSEDRPYTDRACEACFDECEIPTRELGVANPNTNSSDVGGFFANLSRLSTPLGGLCLICAHLINHRLVCRCCGNEQPCRLEN